MPIHLVIEAGRTERQYWRDLWRYRELFYFLAWRDFLVRYKQTSVGVAWALIRPVLTILILTMACKVGGTLDTPLRDGPPVPLELLCAMWWPPRCTNPARWSTCANLRPPSRRSGLSVFRCGGSRTGSLGTLFCVSPAG